MPDRAYLYLDQNQEYRWIRKGGNGEKVGAATEGYVERRKAVANYEHTNGSDAPLLEDLTDEETATD